MAARCSNRSLFTPFVLILEPQASSRALARPPHPGSSGRRGVETLCTNKVSFATLGYKSDKANPMPEGYLWQPQGCYLRIYNAADAVALLSRTRGLIVAGESVERHLYQVSDGYGVTIGY